MATTLSRRQVLEMGLGVAAGSLVAPTRSGAADFDWMQQKGKSIESGCLDTASVD